MDMSSAHHAGSSAHGLFMFNETVYLSCYSSAPLPITSFHRESGKAWLLAHIALMTAAWLFVMPIDVVLSANRSRWHMPTQLVFVVLNLAGVLCVELHHSDTDAYPGNAHSPMGWAGVLVVLMYAATTVLVRLYRWPRHVRHYDPGTLHAEQHHFMLTESEDDVEEDKSDESPESSAASLGHERDMSFDSEHQRHATLPGYSDAHDGEIRDGRAVAAMRALLDKAVGESALGERAHNALLAVVMAAHTVFERGLIIFGFTLVATGVLTYYGLFKGHTVFNGLAHWIKGGVFFLYGIITLARYFGGMADLGWAWNLVPVRNRSAGWRCPSAEMVESGVILFYGVTNVFLEHLGHGSKWGLRDIEHISIAIMFFGAGLAGVLLETRYVQRLLRRAFMPEDRGDTYGGEHTLQRQQRSLHALRLQRTGLEENFTCNPFPALVIYFTGSMMAMHDQNDMFSSMVHKQWGDALSYFALLRLLTYVLIYLRPPRSVSPSRPITELLASFFLIFGGLVFMASAQDVICTLEAMNAQAMLVSNLAIAVTLVVMAWHAGVCSIKGFLRQ